MVMVRYYGMTFDRGVEESATRDAPSNPGFQDSESRDSPSNLVAPRPARD